MNWWEGYPMLKRAIDDDEDSNNDCGSGDDAG